VQILFGGQTIVLDVNTDDQEKAYELLCVCGHKLSEHACPIFWYYPDALHHTIYTSQCTHLLDNHKFHCEQFRIE